MDIKNLIFNLALGALVGWLAGQIKQGYGFGLLPNIIIGIVGSVIGSWLFGGNVGAMVGGGILGTIITGILGALILMFVIGIVKKAA
jgi:uncharacterized membrane protein YeaQ/YmgE (transglycosylase-associated protein family)